MRVEAKLEELGLVLPEPLGKVGAEVSAEQAYQAAGLTALAILGSLKRALGDLDRVTAWLKVFGMVNSAPGFTQQPNVINGFSDLIIEVYGSEGRRSRPLSSGHGGATAGPPG